MSQGNDAPLNRDQQVLLLVATVFVPALLVVWAGLILWFGQSHPHRTRSLAWVGVTYFKGLLAVIAAVFVWQFIARW